MSQAPAAFAQSWQEAEMLYKQGQFLKAAEIYQNLAGTDSSGWQALYNAGNAFYKAGRMPEAMEHYWKAWQINPRHDPLLHNMSRTMELTGDSLAPQGTPSGLYRLGSWFTTDEAVAISVCFWWLATLSLWFIIFKRLRTPWLKYTALLSSIFFVISLIFSIAKVHAGRRQWAVLKMPAMLRQGPSANLPVTAEIPEGRIVWILQQEETWSLIESRREKIKGWTK